MVGLLDVFSARVNAHIVDLHPADFASMTEELRPDRMCSWTFDFPRRSSEKHSTFVAVIADVVRLPDPEKGLGFAHGMRKVMSQNPANRVA